MRLYHLPVILFTCVGLFTSGCATLTGQGSDASEKVSFVDTPEGARLTVQDKVFFAKNSHKLYKQSMEIIDNLKPVFEKAKGKVIIEGHTDSSGSEKYNKKLSKQRSEAVKKAVVDRLNVLPSRFQTIGYGSSRPAVANAKTPEELAKNRRAAFLFPGNTVNDLGGNSFLKGFRASVDKISKWVSGFVDSAGGALKSILSK